MTQNSSTGVGSVFTISALIIAIIAVDQIDDLQRTDRMRKVWEKKIDDRLNGVESEFSVCEIRTQQLEMELELIIENNDAIADNNECLRSTIDTLIGVWPGRAKAPDICGNWEAWKSFGENTYNGRRINVRSSED